MDAIITQVYASSTAAIQGYITSTVVPLWIWLLGVAVLLFVVRAVFSVFGRRRRMRA